MKKSMLSLLLLSLAFLTAGCTTMRRTFPGTEDSYLIGVTDKHAPEEDWAAGAYSLGKANVCFAKTQGENDPNVAQVLFGIIGRAIAVGEMSGELKKMIGGQEKVFDLDLKGIAGDELKKELHSAGEDSKFNPAVDWKTAPLQVTPYAVFSFIDNVKARLWLVLRVEWIHKNMEYTVRGWNCRYLVGLGEPRPLVGEGGWASNNGKLLESTIKKDTVLAMKLMREDLEGNLRTGKEPKAKILANWAFYKNPRGTEIQMIKQEKDYDVILPLVEDEEFFAGINVVPKDFALPASTPVPASATKHGVWEPSK